jgi:hypothetical protein
MKKNNKNILIVSSSIIIIICLLYLLSKQVIKNEDLSEKTLAPVASVEGSPQIEAKPISEVIKKEKEVILIVLDKKYTAQVGEGDSVYKIMENLQKNKENNFSFNYKEYPALGVFIDEINGIKGGNGKYWIYYVNGKESSVGVSNYILDENDIINWELK